MNVKELQATYATKLAEFEALEFTCEADTEGANTEAQTFADKLAELGALLVQLNAARVNNPEALADALERPRVSEFDTEADDMQATTEAREVGRTVPISEFGARDSWGLEFAAPIGAPAITGRFVSYPIVGKNAPGHNAVDINCECEGDSLAIIRYYSARPGQYRSNVPDAPLVQKRYAHGLHGKAIDAITSHGLEMWRACNEYVAQFAIGISGPTRSYKLAKIAARMKYEALERTEYNLVTEADRQRTARARLERDKRVLLAQLADAGLNADALELASKLF